MKLSIKNMTADRRWVPLVIVLFTAVFRAWMLAIKPPHFDEGINGWFVDQMIKNGYYEYDPANYHGPLHFYILFLFKVFFGRNLWALRMPTVIVSTLTVWLVTTFDRFLDRRACWIAALAMAVSPAMEFYGRYAIHESDLVFFLILAVWGGAGIWRFGGMKYLWAAALGATGMILTKETYIIHFAAFALAAPCLWALEKILPGKEPFPRAQNIRYSNRELWSVGVVCAGLIVFFYSGNFLHFELLKGLYLTFGEWIKTGQSGQSGHEKAWWYWFKLVGFYWPMPDKGGLREALRLLSIEQIRQRLISIYEWPVMVGMIASLFYIGPKSNPLIRYLMIYGWGTFTAYSIVHYKTPWCIITIMWPFLFIFGDCFVKLMAVKGCKAAAIFTLALLLAATFARSVNLSFYHYTDENEEYVYVQTFKDMNDKLTKWLFKLVAQDPANIHLKGYVIMDSAYPLPWVLGDFSQVGFYDKGLPPADDMDAAFLLVDDDRQDEVEKNLKENYFTEEFHLRASQEAVTLYLNYDTFHQFFPGRKPDFIQGVAVPASAPPPSPAPAPSPSPARTP